MKNTNLVGISGKMRSGKDTAARIIQELAANPGLSDTEILQRIHNTPVFNPENSPWKVKKFAKALKEMTSLLTGIPVEKFEDQEFKEEPVSDKWNSYTLHVLDNGRLVKSLKNYSSRNDAEIVADFHSRTPYMDTVKFEIQEVPVTSRDMLINVGDAIRNNVHKNAFVTSLFSDFDEEHSKWLITDVRFKNELEEIVRRNGVTLRMSNGKNTRQHASETDLDDASFDCIIDNRGTLEELVAKVRRFCNTYNVI